MTTAYLDFPLSEAPEDLPFTADHVDRAVDLYELQTAALGAQRAKTTYAMRQLSLLHRAGAISKRDTYMFLVTLDTTVEFADPYATIWAEAKREQALMYIDQMHKLLRIGAKVMASIVADSPIPEPRRAGLIERILRGLLGDPK